MTDKIGNGEISTLEELAELDGDEIVLGYTEGYDDPKVPIGKSRSYYHGWLNAQVDRGRMKASEAQRRLVGACAGRRR